MRIIKWIILAVVLLLVIGGVALYLNLNRIVRVTIEKQSTNSLNLTTQLRSANVSLFGGKVALDDFVTGSPQGFASPHMMTLDGIEVAAKLGELRSDPVRVSSITVNGAKLVIEMKGTNFNVKSFVDSLPPGEDKPPTPDEKPLKLIIGNLKVSGTRVYFRPDLGALSAIPGLAGSIPIQQEYELPLPDIELQNIGTGEGSQNGAAIKQVVSLLITSMAAKAAESDKLPPELRQLLSLNVNQIADAMKAKLGAEVNKQLERMTGDLTKNLPPEAGKAVQDVLKNPNEAMKDPGKAIEKGLGGLIPQKKPATRP